MKLTPESRTRIMAERQKVVTVMLDSSTKRSSQRSRIPPLVPFVGCCAKLRSLWPPKKAAVNGSILSSFVSWRHTTWQEEEAIVALTVDRLSGQLRPLTFQLKKLIGCVDMI